MGPPTFFDLALSHAGIDAATWSAVAPRCVSCNRILHGRTAKLGNLLYHSGCVPEGSA